MLLYIVSIIPNWSYGIQLWGCEKSNADIIQRCQDKTLGNIAAAPWYISNETLYKDLHVKYVRDYIKEYAKTHNNRLQQHPNQLANKLLDTENNTGRLKRTEPHDLIIN